jgi:hypothetical protein
MKQGIRHTSRRTLFLIDLLAPGLGPVLAMTLFCLLMAGSLRREALPEQQPSCRRSPPIPDISPVEGVYNAP